MHPQHCVPLGARACCRLVLPPLSRRHRFPRRFHRLSQLCGDVPDTTHLDTHFERFLQLRDVFCIKEFLSGW
jgi:hypothetical protein